jgi:hypothetical protein
MIKHLISAAVFAICASSAAAECKTFSGGISLCDVPEAWTESPNADEANQATYLINGQTFAILALGPGAQTPTEAIQHALDAAAGRFNLGPDMVEQINSGASSIDSISAVFVDYTVTIPNVNTVFYRTTTAWSPNLTLRLTTYGFANNLAEDFDDIHNQLVAATKLGN